MPSKSSLKLTLIFVCVLLHFIIGTGLYYSHPFSKELLIFSGEEVDFLDVSKRLSGLARIIGGYGLSKVADRIGFIKTMKIICLGYIAASFLLTFFDSINLFQSASVLCLTHGLFSFLRWSSFIVPIIYIFQHYKKIDHYKYGALAWTAALFGIMLINLAVTNITNFQCNDWVMLYVASGILSFIIYSYVATFPEFEMKIISVTPFPKEALLLAFLFAGICGAGLTYQYEFVEHYVKNVMILKTSGQQVIYSPFWVTLFLTFLPAAKIAKKLNPIKIIQLSLAGILFSVSLFYVFPFFNYYILFVHQVMFAFFFGIFLSPSLGFIYRLLQGHSSCFYMNFNYCFGFSCFTLVAAYLSELNFLPSPLMGAALIALLMTLCLWIMHYYDQKMLDIKKAKDTKSSIYIENV